MKFQLICFVSIVYYCLEHNINKTFYFTNLKNSNTDGSKQKNKNLYDIYLKLLCFRADMTF